jgi:single-stranded-DNA-specific exonuclease
MDILNRLLSYYSLDQQALEERKAFKALDSLKDPFTHLDGFSCSLSLLEKHLKAQDKIVIYGDYDADGITSTSILVRALLLRKAKVGFFIPSRYKEGYGANAERIEEFALKGYKLLITSDNGVAANEPIKKAKDLGLDVIVIDHHTIEGELPKADGFIHPVLGKYVTYNISAAFLALLVSYGLLGFYDEYSAALAGIAVFSDSMPLVEMNLTLAKHALRVIGEGKYQQFNLLLKHQSENKPISSHDMAFNIVSYLNSLGRLNTGIKINNAVRFLVSSDPKEIAELYNFILLTNEEKKTKMKDISNQIKGLHSSDPLEIYRLDETPIGLVGALASSLSAQHSKSVIIFASSPSDSSLLVGSGRSPEGINLFEIVSRLKGELVAFGGHKCALGLTIHQEDYEKIKAELSAAYSELPEEKEKRKAILLDEDDISLESLAVLSSFEPFGEGFKEPVFALKLRRRDFSVSKDGRHLLKRCQKGNIVFFSYPKSLDQEMDKEYLFLGSLKEDSFNGEKKAQFAVSEIKDAQECTLII